MDQAQGVAAAAGVLVAAAVVGFQSIPAGVVETAEADRRPVFVGFGGVVEHHVQHHLETFCLQCGDHRAEFSDGRADIIIPAAAASRVACVGAEEADGVVAPIVVQAAFVHAVFVDGGVDGQQRQRGHAETLEMRDRRRLRQPGIGAAQRVGDAGQRHRETLDVQLVQHEF